ncbi:flagellar hook-length control protein FliK [Pseudarthrobacter phenanthrenivorans]|nr:flagellar hook-length control protein FliK [Pseudarthrobacter phenanthrenivorans]
MGDGRQRHRDPAHPAAGQRLRRGPAVLGRGPRSSGRRRFRPVRAAGRCAAAHDGRGPRMIPVELPRAGTLATTTRRDKTAGVGDATFGVQMQKALAAGPSERRGGGDGNAAGNSGMEGTGPEPGASAPAMLAPGLPGVVRTETVPTGAASMAAPPGTVSGAVPVTGAPLAGTSAAGTAAGESVAVELPLPQVLAVAGGYPAVPVSVSQDSAAAWGTTAAPQVPLQGAAGAAGTAVAAAAQGLPAGSAVPPGTAPTPASASVAAPIEGTPNAAAPGTSASGVASGTAAGAPSASVDGATANQPGPAAVPAPAPGAPGAPAQAPGNAVTAAPAPATAHAPSPAHPPLAGQLSGPLFSLSSARAGEHTMTLSVTPENLGPVTVRAHIGTEGVRVELFAPNDAGREALRAILQDLRRDLAAAGLGTGLDLSARNNPHDGTGDGAGGTGGEPSDDGPRQLRLPSGQPAVPAGPDTHTHLRNAGTTGLDVLA